MAKSCSTNSPLTSSIGIHLILLILLSLISPEGTAQHQPDFNIPANIPRPCWVDKIDWTRPNIIVIDSLVKSCPEIPIRREVNGEQEEDPYRNALHRWLRSGNIFIASDGQISVNTDSGRINFQRSVDRQREYQLKMAQSQALVWSRNTPSASTGVSSWSVLGPVDTYKSGQKRTTQANIYCLAVAPSNPNILFCGSETGIIFKSTDKGLNWVSVSDALTARSPASIVVDPADEHKVYVALHGVGTIIKSTDGGTNWATLTNFSGGVTEQMVINPSTGRIIAASANGIYYSDNEGTTWTKATTSIAPGTSMYDIALNPGDPSIVYAVSKINTSTTKDLVLYRSTNSGESFTAVTLPANTSTSGARLAVTTANAGYV